MINEEEEKITINKRELEQIINNAITHQIEFIISELKRNFEKRLELFTQFTLQQLTEIYSLFSNVINSYKVIPENRGSFLKMSCCSNCKAIFQRINGYLCNRCDHFEICHSCFIQFKLNPNFHEKSHGFIKINEISGGTIVSDKYYQIEVKNRVESYPLAHILVYGKNKVILNKHFPFKITVINKDFIDTPSFTFEIITPNSIFSLQKTWVASLKSQEKAEVDLYFTINNGAYKEGNYEVDVIMKNSSQITCPFRVTIWIMSYEKYPKNFKARASYFLKSLSSKNKMKFNNDAIINDAIIPIIKNLGLYCSNEMIYDEIEKKN